MHVKPKKKPVNWFKRIFLIALVVYLGFFWKGSSGLTGIDRVKDFFVDGDWSGWVYPLGRDGKTVRVGTYDDYDSCIVATHTHVTREYSGWVQLHYECGYRCDPPIRRGGRHVCKVVRD